MWPQHHTWTWHFQLSLIPSCMRSYNLYWCVEVKIVTHYLWPCILQEKIIKQEDQGHLHPHEVSNIAIVAVKWRSRNDKWGWWANVFFRLLRFASCVLFSRCSGLGRFWRTQRFAIFNWMLILKLPLVFSTWHSRIWPSFFYMGAGAGSWVMISFAFVCLNDLKVCTPNIFQSGQITKV